MLTQFMLIFSPPFRKKIKPYRERGGGEEAGAYKRVGQLGFNIGAGNFIGIIFNKRVGQVMLAQGSFNVPLPIGNGAVAPAKPNAQNIPAAGGNGNTNQVQPPCARPYPPQQVKPHYNRMENG